MDKHEKKVTINYLKSQKGKSKLTMITAYDALFANIFDGFIDMILIGDSVEMNFNGRDDTLKATMQNMIYHTKAVCRGAKTSYIIADMPFGSIKDEKTALKIWKRCKNLREVKYALDDLVEIYKGNISKIDEVLPRNI